MHEPHVRLHEPRQTVVHTLDELLIDRFGPDDLAGDDPFPLLLQKQNNRVQLSAGAEQTVAQRAQSAGGAAFSKAAQQAAQWANSKVGLKQISQAGLHGKVWAVPPDDMHHALTCCWHSRAPHALALA
jgi:hypothetical protein